jgi:hypothetical protein
MSDEKENEPNRLRKFICIDYPGYVENESEAIRSLGGYDRIYQAFERKNSKLLVNYTPDNIFSKMICSVQIDEPDSNDQDANDSNENLMNDSNDINNSQHESSGQLSRDTMNLKSKNNDFIMPCLIMSVKTSRSNPKVVKAEIVGKIKKMYCFTKMADFQYLPMGNVSSKQAANQNVNLSPKSAMQTQFNYTAFYDNFLFSNIDNYQQELKTNNLPQLFILPPFFSRFDDPINYAFRAEPNKKEPVDRNPKGSDKSTPNKSFENLERVDKRLNYDSENGADEDDEDGNESSRNEKSGYSSESSEKRRDENKDDSSNNNLIRSRRQERSSQAILVTYICSQVPASKISNITPKKASHNN